MPIDSTSSRKVALIIVNGGYNSCAGNVPSNGDIAETNYLTTVGDRAIPNVIQPTIDKGYEVYWIISCFWGSTSNTLQVKTSTNPTHADIISWSTTDQGMFYTYLTNFAQTYMEGVAQEFRLILIGHSNGGYNVLKLAEGLADSVSFSYLKSNSYLVSQIYTLDPISVACSPSSISLSVTINIGNMPPACLRAPTTDEVDYTKIHNNFDLFENYYQTNYTSLHSGPITNANNAQVSLPGVQTSANNAHTRITSDESTWSDISSHAVP
ncbi:MAG: hypothetical protein HYR96_13450 [Deltaproteobacteria bacterium]|nr:hypothetical protein [Deltaproteobacteria bacterium]